MKLFKKLNEYVLLFDDETRSRADRASYSFTEWQDYSSQDRCYVRNPLTGHSHGESIAPDDRSFLGRTLEEAIANLELRQKQSS